MVFPIVAPPNLREPWIMICTNSNLHYIRNLLCKSELFWLCGLWQEDMFKCPLPIFAVLLLSALWRGPGTWFVQFWIPFTEGWFVLSLIEIALLVLEKKIFKNFQRSFTLLLLSSLGEGCCPSFVRFWIPFAYGWFVSTLVKIDKAILEKTSKMWMFNRQTNDGQWAIRKAPLSFQLRKAQVI
jgi:hypothetical protein